MWMKLRGAEVLENESLPPPSSPFAGAIIESHQFVHARAAAAAAAAHACLAYPGKGARDITPTDRPTKRLIMTRAVAVAVALWQCSGGLARSVTAYAISSCLVSSQNARLALTLRVHVRVR